MDRYYLRQKEDSNSLAVFSTIKRVGDKEYMPVNEAQAEIDELLKAVSEMECTCLPYAEITGEGQCQRCLLLNKHQGE